LAQVKEIDDGPQFSLSNYSLKTKHASATRSNRIGTSRAPRRHRALDIAVVGLPGHQRGTTDQRLLGPVVAVLNLHVVDNVDLDQALVAALAGVADVEQLLLLVSGDAVRHSQVRRERVMSAQHIDQSIN